MAASVETLLEALPYIREFHGKTVVIKYGGSAMTDEKLKQEFTRDICLLKFVGLNPIIVHGGGPQITEHMEKLGMEVKFVDGRRVSDRETVEVAKMVLVGKLNTDIVLNLSRNGQPAVGLSGDDGQLFQIRQRVEGEGDIGFVGELGPTDVDVDVIHHIAEDYIPVIATVAADAEGNSYNINADEAAGAVAGALKAHKLIILTDVVGWLKDVNDESSLINHADVSTVKKAIDSGEIAGGMVPKLGACIEAVEHGVSAAHIIDGRVEHSLLVELFTDAGIGTKVSPDR